MNLARGGSYESPGEHQISGWLMDRLCEDDAPGAFPDIGFRLVLGEGRNTVQELLAELDNRGAYVPPPMPLHIVDGFYILGSRR